MKLNRRGFLIGSAGVAAVTSLAGCVTRKVCGPRALAPGEKANVAIIGMGIQGRTALLPQFLAQYDRGAKVVACCDCDKTRREDGAKRVDALEAALLKHAVTWPEEPGFLLYLARLRLLQGRPDDALEIVGTVPVWSRARRADVRQDGLNKVKMNEKDNEWLKWMMKVYFCEFIV